MLVQGKSNVNGSNKKKGRFQSFQNLKDNKFSAYKYERNMLIGKNNYNNVNEEENDYFYQNQRQQHDSNESEMIIKVNKQHHQQTNGVDNLCQLWDKLGQQQQQKSISETIDNNNTSNNKNQLTQQELMKCFGDEEQQAQEDNQYNKVIVNRIQGSCRVDVKNNNQLQQGREEEEGDQVLQLQEEEGDLDLMDIWGQDQHTQQATAGNNTSSQSSDKQQVINNNNGNYQQRKDKSKQEEQHYHWIDDQSRKVQQTTHYQNTLIVSNKNKLTEDNNSNNGSDNDDEQMQLQDPNLIVFQRYNNKQNQQQSTSQHQPKQPIGNKPKISTLSIINEIHLQNNSKGMTKLIPNRHYHIFDTKTFSLNTFKPNTYSYFGVQAKNYSLLQPSSPILNDKDNIFYLYLFQTQQALLEMKPEPVDKSYWQFLSVQKTVSVGPNEKITKRIVQYRTDFCYKVRICSTKQHIATLFYKVIKDGYLYDLRLYDQYQKTHSEPIALIQVKDGYVNECCYCDTNVFLEKSYMMNPYYAFVGQKNNISHIQKLRMILNLKNGKLTANMGIGGIQSSPFNCCLQNQQSQKFIYLMGLLYENMSDDEVYCKEGKLLSNQNSCQQLKRKNSFIIKVGEGVTPLIGLAITAGRKLYVDSFQ